MKQRIRRIRRDLARRRMMHEVPTATAVIVNPTHYAVALKYTMDSKGAPKVVAKGKNYLALRIRQKAIENQVPLIENPPLAQGLYKSVDVGQEIPAQFYKRGGRSAGVHFQAHEWQAKCINSVITAAVSEGAYSTRMKLAARRKQSPRPLPGSNCRRTALANWKELGVPIAVLGIVIALITPLPGFMLDVLIVTDIMMSVDRDDGRDVHPQAGGIQRLPHHAAAADAVSSGSQYFLYAPDSDERQHRHRRRRRRHPGVRQFRGGRQLHHRRGHLPGADRHPVRRHQPRRGAHLGSHRALHSGCAARQADVHRFGPELRA